MADNYFYRVSQINEHPGKLITGNINKSAKLKSAGYKRRKGI